MSNHNKEEKKNKVIVTSFSGGRTSAFGTQAVKQHFPNEEVYHIFMDTGAEHPATYDFVNGVDNIFNLDLIRLRVSINPELGKGNAFDVVNGTVTQFDLKPYTDTISKYGVPYVGGMFCTDRMKTTPFKKYCEKRWGKGNYEVWLGIRGDEPKRLVGFNKTKPDISCYTQLRLCDLQDEDITDLFVQARKEGVHQAIIDCDFTLSNKAIELFSKRIVALDNDNMHYLAEIEPHFYKQDTYIYWNKQDQLYGVDLRIPDYLGNCEYCPKKSNLKIAAAAKAEPEHSNSG